MCLYVHDDYGINIISGGGAIMDERLLTVKEVVEITRFAERTIRKYISIGKIKSVRFGVKGIRIPISEIERLKKGV